MLALASLRLIWHGKLPVNTTILVGLALLVVGAALLVGSLGDQRYVVAGFVLAVPGLVVCRWGARKD